MNVEAIVASAAGTLIVGLFVIIWYFVQRFISRGEIRDKEISYTLSNLNTTMTKINMNLEIYQVKTGTELQGISTSVTNLSEGVKNHEDTLNDHEIRIQVIEEKGKK